MTNNQLYHIHIRIRASAVGNQITVATIRRCERLLYLEHLAPYESATWHILHPQRFTCRIPRLARAQTSTSHPLSHYLLCPSTPRLPHPRYWRFLTTSYSVLSSFLRCKSTTRQLLPLLGA